MRRRSLALWIPLLAALLAGSLAQRSTSARSGETIGVYPSLSSVALPVPVARLQPSAHLRLPIDRQGSQPWSMLPSEVCAGTAPSHLRGIPAEICTGPIAETARHFPLFPTGPPSHG